MKTMRRAIATAAIGVAAAGIIGMASTSASAAPSETTGDVSVTASCEYYVYKMNYWEDQAAKYQAQGNHDAAQWALKNAQVYEARAQAKC